MLALEICIYSLSVQQLEMTQKQGFQLRDASCEIAILFLNIMEVVGNLLVLPKYKPAASFYLLIYFAF